MRNFLDCYSGIDWQSVFDGTYDAERPEGRWFDPVKIWTRRYWEFMYRPADPTVLQDPALWELFVTLMLAAGYARDEVTDTWLRSLAISFFVYLKDAAHEAFGTLPRCSRNTRIMSIKSRLPRMRKC